MAEFLAAIGIQKLHLDDFIDYSELGRLPSNVIELELSTVRVGPDDDFKSLAQFLKAN